MATSRGYQGTKPSPLSNPPDADAAPRLTTPSDFALAGVVGSELSEPLAAMQYVLQEFDRTRNVTRAHMQLLNTALESARTIAMQSQQIARLAGGKLRQSHERLRLDELLQSVLTERSAVFQQRGVELYPSIQPVEVIVDAGLLSSLLDTALDWAISMGRRLVVTLEIKNWPEHGMLLFKISESVATGKFRRPGGSGDEESGGDTLAWYLLSEIARTMGVSVDRVTSPRETSLMLEFPRTVKRLEGLTAVEVETGFDSLHSESRPLAGHRVLVISNDVRLQIEIKEIARGLGLVVETVTDSKSAVRVCERDAPHLVIIDEPMRDDEFNELSEDLRKVEPNFPFVEIATGTNVLEMAGWMSDSMTRLSRDTIRAQLASILVMELAKVM